METDSTDNMTSSPKCRLMASATLFTVAEARALWGLQSQLALISGLTGPLVPLEKRLFLGQSVVMYICLLTDNLSYILRNSETLVLVDSGTCQNEQ